MSTSMARGARQHGEMMSGSFWRFLACACLVWTLSECSATFIDARERGQPEFCTVFTHMVKSGGTTIKDQLITASLHENAQNTGTACSTPTQVLEGVEGKCHGDVQSASVICSPLAELLRAPLKAAGRQCQYFTMMRHPIDRLVSAFFYCPTTHDLNRKASKWCSGTQDESTAKPLLLEYATTHWKNMAMRQLMLSTYCPSHYRGFCQDNQAAPPSPADMASPDGLVLLKEVQKTLGSYTAVGIFEEFALSMALFDAKVASPVRHWIADTVKNPGEVSGLREEVLAWAHTDPDIRNFLEPDLLIYQYAVSVFKQQTSAELGTVWP